MDAAQLGVWRGRAGRVLAGRDLELVTQPIVDLRDDTVVGYEALTRFPGAPSADPAVWFAVAEEFGVAPELMAATLRRQFGLSEHLPRGCLLAVKVSCLGLEADAVRPVLEQAPLDGVVVHLDEPERFGHGDDPDDLADLADLVTGLRARGRGSRSTSDGRDRRAGGRRPRPRHRPGRPAGARRHRARRRARDARPRGAGPARPRVARDCSRTASSRAPSSTGSWSSACRSVRATTSAVPVPAGPARCPCASVADRRRAPHARRTAGRRAGPAPGGRALR